jgi:hypothetical protein
MRNQDVLKSGSSLCINTTSDMCVCVCFDVMYSGEYNVLDVTLSVYPHPHRGQANFSSCPVWIYTQSNIKNIIAVNYTVYSVTTTLGD